MQSTNSEYVTSLSLSVALYTVKIKEKKKRVSFNPYKDIYYCQPLKNKVNRVEVHRAYFHVNKKRNY